MENILNKNLKMIFSLIVALVIIGITSSCFAASKLKFKELNVGDKLKFNASGETWNLYNTLKDAKSNKSKNATKKLKNGETIVIKKLHKTLFNKVIETKSGKFLNYNSKAEKRFVKVIETKVTKEDTSKWSTVYLTNYRPHEGNWENLATANIGQILARDRNGNVGIIHPNVYVNSNGWYVYRYNNVDYVILARLKNKANSYCGFDKNEIVKFEFKDKIYKGVILDIGGAKRDTYATLDILVTEECTYIPGLAKVKALGTDKTLSVISNHNNQFTQILRYK